MELKVLNDFFKEIENDLIGNYLNIFGFSIIPVYIFNPFNLISTTFFGLFKNSIVLDCAEIESKTEFFTEIFKGILGEFGGEFSNMLISYDFAAFLKEIKSTANANTNANANANAKVEDVLLIFNNSSQINLSYLDDFVRLWERKSNQLPKLKFVFDDSVSFLGMESRLRDRFRVKELKVARVNEVFDDFVIEIINNDLPFLLHPQLMKHFVDLTTSETITFNSLLNQIKFVLISHFSSNTLNIDDMNVNIIGLKDIFMFITDLSIKLKKIRPSTPSLSPSKDFYSVILDGILVDSQAYAEIVNELKSLAPNDFISLFNENVYGFKGLKSSKLNEFIKKMKEEMKEEISNSNSSKIKDFQLDLITSISSFIRSYEVLIPTDYVINDKKGNLRRAFEADPQTALQFALKFPSIYLNCCKNCCSNEEISSMSAIPSFSSSILSPLFHNKSKMLDICLLYRISLEFPSKSINLMSWYKSFSSIVSKKQNEKSIIT